MSEDKKPESTDEKPGVDGQQAPVDALSMTPDELEEEKAKQPTSDQLGAENPDDKKLSPIKRFFRKVNVYLLIFILIISVAGVYTAVSYLNSQKPKAEPTLATQDLSEAALKQLANTDATVGNTSQTLTIQGNAVIAGQSLMRGNLNVAGNFQTGGAIQGPSLTVSGTSNLGTAQINSLQVAQDTAIQGSATAANLTVAGNTSLNVVTASQLTVSRLILSGNAVLQVPNHLAFTGASPGRGATGPALGSGGTASVSGSDTAGTVNISTGNGTATGCFVRINFAQSFTSSPRVIISPVGAGAGATQYYVDRNQSGFSICTAAPAPANQTFSFDYFVTG